MSTLQSSTADLLNDLDGFRVEIDAGAARADIILDRPPMNIITMHQRDQLRAVFEELDRNEAVRVIVLRAEGRNFSSGGDIPGFLAASPETVSRLADNIAAPNRCSKPVVVALKGYSFGVGLELPLACDFRIVCESSQLALPEQRIGMIPGSGGSARLVKMIGLARAKDMCMRSRRISGAQAYDWGIAVSCVSDAELETATDALVEELKQFSPLAQRTLKRVLNDADNSPLQVAIEREGDAYGRLRSSDDFREGVESFKAKRPGVFKGS
jgi:2-oxoglutaroyl-CoA hydrolase